MKINPNDVSPEFKFLVTCELVIARYDACEALGIDSNTQLHARKLKLKRIQARALKQVVTLQEQLNWLKKHHADIAFKQRLLVTGKFPNYQSAPLRRPIRSSHRKCKGCDCGMDEFTPSCPNCSARHSMRRSSIRKQLTYGAKAK